MLNILIFRSLKKEHVLVRFIIMRKKRKSAFNPKSLLFIIFIILFITIVQYSFLFSINESNSAINNFNIKNLRKFNIKKISFSNNINDRFRLIIQSHSNKHKITKPNLIFSSLIVTFTFNNKEYQLNYNEKTGEYWSDFFIPIEDNYTISMRINNKEITHVCHYINSIKHIKKDLSTMRCFGHDFNDRFCELNNTCFDNKKFIFFTNITTAFHTNIVYPGSRPIPRDYPSCRNAVRIISSNSSYESYDSLHEFKERSFLTCRWYGMQHLWHTLFDYTVPIWWSMNEFGGHKEDDRVFLIDDNTNKQKGFLLKDIFTNTDVINIRLNESYQNKTCFDHLILGLPKTELVVTPSKWTNGLFLPYEYKGIAFKGFREQGIKKYVEHKEYCNETSKPRILIINRATSKRFIVNGEELYESIKTWCPHCDVSYELMENMSIGQQIESVCNASILISIHGSALSHMVWMRNEHNAIIEIFPYKYDCRDWYQQVAESYGLKYFSWINTNKSNTFQGRKGLYKHCITKENACEDESCHEYLRDQPTIVDINSFKKVFITALKSIVS